MIAAFLTPFGDLVCWRCACHYELLDKATRATLAETCTHCKRPVS